jgi:tellurite resistance protein TerC
VDQTIATPLLWAGFVALVLVLLAVDLLLHRAPGRERESVRGAVLWTVVWVAFGVAFGAALWAWRGSEVGLEYFAGYLVEKSLSVDNIFIFLVLFRAFAVPKQEQHRVLFWGVLGAIAMRALFVLAGAELLEHFHLAVVPLGLFLAITGVRMLLRKHDEPAVVDDGEKQPAPSRIMRAIARIIPTTNGYRGSHFVVRENAKLLATPLLLALIAIELTDVIVAVDSVPAVFAVTEDPFLVFSSNIFALLGLRSLTFVLADVLPKLRYLPHGLGLVLAFVGAKMALEPWFPIGTLASLGGIAAIIVVAVVASLANPRARS